MSRSAVTEPVTGSTSEGRGRRIRRPSLRGARSQLAAALVAPTVALVAIFVYGFIIFSVRVSVSANYTPLDPDLTRTPGLLDNYGKLFETTRFQIDLRNIVLFTVLTLLFSVAIGLALAALVYNASQGAGFFRAAFMLPYALSFIVTGVVWRWIFTPDTGINLLLKYTGISSVYQAVTGKALEPAWITSAQTVGDLNVVLDHLFPRAADVLQVQLGIPLALIPVVLAATWQLTGFAMAIFVAGMGSVPAEIYEAARVDGCGGWRAFWHLTLPLIRGSIVVAVVLLAHVALKCFDLIYAMVGTGPGFATDVPAIFVYDQMFRALRYNNGAAASIVMLLVVAAVVVPYLVRSFGKRAEAS